MELLGDVGHVESHLFLLGDSVIVGARLVHSLRQMYHWLRKHFGRTQWYSWVRAQVKAHFDPFGDCANVDAR
jgi:hypothetical protein